MTLNQYTVEPVTDSKVVAYRLTGSKGGVIRLLRNQDNPSILYAVKSNGNVAHIDGSSWFTDKNGQIEPISVEK